MLITNKLKKPTNSSGAVVLLRGTFSPIHSGHLHVLDLAREFIAEQSHKLLGEYLSPMHYKREMEKLGDDSIPTYHRLNMIREVLQHQDSLMLFDWECHKDEPADALEVTEEFKSRLLRSVPELSEDKLIIYYVCGMDSIPKGISDTWFKTYNLLCVVNREGDEAQFNKLKQRYPEHVHKIQGEARNVRSEVIRKTLRESKDVEEDQKVEQIVKFVHLKEVAKYIVKHNLWDSEEKEKGVDHSELFPTIFKNFGLYNFKIGNNQFWVEKAMNTEMGKPKFIVSVLNSDQFEMKYFIGNVSIDSISEEEIEFNINTLSNLSKVLHMSEQEEDTLEHEALQHGADGDEFSGKLKVTITHHLRIPKTGKCTYFNEMFPDYRWFVLPFYNSNSDDLDFATKTKYLAYGMAKFHMASSLVSVSRTTELNIKEMSDTCQKLVKLDKKFGTMAKWLNEFEQSTLFDEWEYLPKMYIHNDFQPKNILVHNKEQLTTVFIIDAEGGIFGPRIFDLYFLLLWNDKAEGLNKENYPRRFNSVMHIYQQHAPSLTPTEKRLLAPALAIKSIMTATAVGNEAVNPDCVAPKEVLQDVMKGHFRGFDMLTRDKAADELVQIIDSSNKNKKTIAA